MSTQQKGYESERTRILSEITGIAEGGATLDEVYRLAETVYGRNTHYVSVGMMELVAGGVLGHYQDGNRTYLELEDTGVTPDDLPGYDVAISGDHGSDETDRANIKITAPWTQTVDGEKVPTLRRGLLDDFFERHEKEGWDRKLFKDGERLGSTGRKEESGGTKEFRLTVVNDYGNEEDLIRIRAAFHAESEIFTQKNRDSYARNFMTPLTTLQQRNGWINRSADAAADEIDSLLESREEVRGEDFTAQEVVLDELASLGSAGWDADYRTARDAAVEEYYTGDLRLSRLMLPFSGEMENRFVDGEVEYWPLPVGSDDGQDKGPALLREHIDMFYAAVSGTLPPTA